MADERDTSTEKRTRMSRRGRELLAEWEGLMLHEYYDSAGLPTIGVGHLLTRSEIATGLLDIGGRHVPYGGRISREDALDLLEQDLGRFESIVRDHVKVPLEQWQFDAMVSFAFNVGVEAFLKSSLLKLLNDGEYDLVPEQLLRWVNAKGHRVPGLVNRREKEIAMWEGRA